MSDTIISMKKAGLFARRFVVEVLASTAVTACAATATTVWLHSADTPAKLSSFKADVIDGGVPSIGIAAASPVPQKVVNSLRTIARETPAIPLPPPRPDKAIALLAKISPAQPIQVYTVPTAVADEVPSPISIDVADDVLASSDLDAAGTVGSSSPNWGIFKPNRATFTIAMPNPTPESGALMRTVHGVEDAVATVLP